MATKDAVITIKGDLAEVRLVEIIKEPDGSYKIAVRGEAKTSDGKPIGLDIAIERASAGVAVFDNIWAHALPVLRKANGLE